MIIKEKAKKYYPIVKEIREHLHQFPELSFQEYETSKFIQKTLEQLNIPYEVKCTTGVVGLIQGSKPGKTVLLRADMDALPIIEEADVSFISKNNGVMHACGHDGHTASLLGAAMILNSLKDQFSGNVKLMFQPAEETVGGALPMIKEGILENPKVDAAFGLHLWGPVKKNKIALKKGAMMAAPDSFLIKIIGKGGHAASPHQCIDPINIGIQVIASLQNIITRKTDPLKPIVISFCSVHGGDATNVIPNEFEIKGTLRTLDYETRLNTPKLMDKVIKGIVESYDATYVFDMHKGYPAVINDDLLCEKATISLKKILGEDKVYELENPNMGGEDFAYLGEYVPSVFYFYGINDGIEPIHHHPEFKWDSDVLEHSSASLAQLAFDFLGGKDE